MGRPPITGRAPGYWGRNPHTRINQENVVAKVTRWNYDKIMAMGLPYAVWREADQIQGNLLVCSCFKDTAKQPDVPCMSCYGTGKIPGYFKQGTRTYWASSFDPGWTLTNVVVDKDNRPFRLKLVDGQTSGTAVSAVIPVSATGKLGAWESRVDAFTRDGGVASSVTCEFSVNGTVWHAMSQLDVVLPTTQIQFRVTLARNSAGVKSPLFEIVRARFATATDIRGELSEPVIRILPTWDKNAETRTNYGNRVDSSGKRFWTLPLTFFDESIQRETVAARLADDVMVEVRYGGSIGTRFAIIEQNYSDTFGEFTRQEFGLRQYSGDKTKLDGEFAYRVF